MRSGSRNTQNKIRWWKILGRKFTHISFLSHTSLISLRSIIGTELRIYIGCAFPLSVSIKYPPTYVLHYIYRH